MSTQPAIDPDWLPESSIEQRFLLALIGRQDDARQQRWRTLLPSVNWPRLLQTAQPQLHPYLHFCLQTRAGAACCPPKVMNQLAGARQLAALHNLRRLSEMRNVLAAFAQHRIPLILLKGIVLAHVAYGDPSLRPMNDVDLLVHSADRERAKLLLYELGYEWPERWRGAHPGLRPLLHMHEDYETELALQKRGTNILIELHTQLEISAPLFPVPVEDLWDRSVARQCMGLPIRTLQAEDFLTHLCLHLARNHVYNTGLLPLVDLLKWIETQGPWDWESLSRRSESKQYEPYVSFTLSLARDLLGLPVPASQVSDAAMKQLAWGQLWDDHRVYAPALVAALAESSPLDRARCLLNRLRPMYGCELTSRQNFVHAIRTGLARILVDIKIKLPHYLKLLLSGRISPRSMKQKIKLVEEKQKLSEFLQGNEQKLTSADDKAVNAG